MTLTLHPDWPELSDERLQPWDLPEPWYDFVSALDAVYGDVEKITVTQVAKIERYRVSWHGQVWVPGSNDAGGTELDMQLLGKLHDGRWFALEAWNDYTGWGCQDGADLYIGRTRKDVIANGLTESGRSALGLPTVAEQRREA